MEKIMNNNVDMQKLIKFGLFLGIVLAFFLVTTSLKVIKEYGYVGADIPPVNTVSASASTPTEIILKNLVLIYVCFCLR